MFKLIMTWTRKKAAIVKCMAMIIAICEEIMHANNAELLKANAKKDFDSVRHIQKEIFFVKEVLNISRTILTETQSLTTNRSAAALLKLTTSNIGTMLYPITARRSRQKEIVKNFRKANRVMKLIFAHQPTKKQEFFSWARKPAQAGTKFLFQSQ